MQCRICGSHGLKTFLSLGQTPLANGFLTKGDLRKEEKSFPLEVCFCQGCKLVQLTCVVPPEIMFKNYVYVSSTTKTFQSHFAKMAGAIKEKFALDENSLVVDIGCNDGLLLKAFKKFGIGVIGIEPAANVATVAEAAGIETVNDFLNRAAVEKIIDQKGPADLVTATNVFAHMDDLASAANNVKLLLREGGVFVAEVQYFVDTMEKMTFDNVYHEHLSYFTLTSLDYFFARQGMEIFHVEKVDTHGGSLRIFITKDPGRYPQGPSVREILEYEKNIGVDNIQAYKDFAERVYHVKDRLVEFFDGVKKMGKSIVGYGAPAKGNTLLNFCQLGTQYLDFLVEDNPWKQGLFTPGTHIPVVRPEALEEMRPDYILILAWNFAKEILQKTRRYAKAGTRFIIPLPKLKII